MRPSQNLDLDPGLPDPPPPPPKGVMALPALVDSALAIAKANTAAPGAGGVGGEDGGDLAPGQRLGAEAALMALEALTACTPQEREANRWEGGQTTMER